jgi:outer membrane lipoprotein-sorting protein
MNHDPTNQSDSESQGDILQRAIASLQEETFPAGPPAQLISDTLRALAEGEPPRPKSLSFIPRTPAMKLLTTAAGLALSLGLVTLVTLSIRPSSSAFAQAAYGQAIKQVSQARTLSYIQSLTIEGKEQPVRTKDFIAEDGRKRSEMPAGSQPRVVTIFDTNGYIRLTLLHDTKTALVRSPQASPTNAGQMFVDWLEGLKQLGDKPDKQLGQKEMDGKQVTGFVATQGNRTFTIWVDIATRQPVRIEYDSPIKGTGYQKVALSDFRFNDQLDESLFSFAVPDGYTVRQQPSPQSVPGGEESVVEALRGYTQRSGGKFPSTIAAWHPWTVLLTKDSKDGVLTPETTRILGHLGAITAFLSGLSKDDYEYLGDGKTLDQKSEIVFWYKRKDGVHRAIYGDLSVQDIAADKLPKK